MALPKLIDTEHSDRDGTRRPFVLPRTQYSAMSHDSNPKAMARREFNAKMQGLWKLYADCGLRTCYGVMVRQDGRMERTYSRQIMSVWIEAVR